MILRRFNLDDIKNCKTLDDAFEMMGIGLREDSKQDLNIRDKKVFGKRAYYANMIMNDKTYNAIYEQLKPQGKKWYNRSGDRMPSADALQWTNYSPISNGPRYEKVEQMAGGISEDVLYIITPEDDLYEEDPSLTLDKEE